MDLIIDIENRAIVQSFLNPIPRQIPPLFEWEKIPLRIMLTKPFNTQQRPLDYAENPDWEIVAVLCGGTGQPVGQGQPAPIAKADAFEYDPDTHFFSDILDLTPDAVADFVGSRSCHRSTLEVQYRTEMGIYICAQVPVTLNAIVYPPTA